MVNGQQERLKCLHKLIKKQVGVIKTNDPQEATKELEVLDKAEVANF